MMYQQPQRIAYPQQQQQPPLQAVPGPGAPQPQAIGGPQLPSPTKDINTASACKLGQETLQEIVQKTTELFQLIKVTQVSEFYLYLHVVFENYKGN